MPGVRLTPRGYGLLVFAAGALAASLISRPEYVAALTGSSLALAAFLMLYHAWFTVKASLAASLVRVERRLEGVRREGGVSRVVLRIHVPGTVFPGVVEAVDRPPPGLVLLEPPRVSVPVPPGGWGEAWYTVRLRAGRHRWGRPRLRLVDPLGLFEADLGPVDVEGLVEAVVPVTVYEPGVTRAVRFHAEASAARTPMPVGGVSTVFLELREYMPDDDSRLID